MYLEMNLKRIAGLFFSLLVYESIVNFLFTIQFLFLTLQFARSHARSLFSFYLFHSFKSKCVCVCVFFLWIFIVGTYNMGFRIAAVVTAVTAAVASINTMLLQQQQQPVLCWHNHCMFVCIYVIFVGDWLNSTRFYRNRLRRQFRISGWCYCLTACVALHCMPCLCVVYSIYCTLFHFVTIRIVGKHTHTHHITHLSSYMHQS